MEYEHMDFVEAVEELAKMQGLEVPREGGRSEATPRKEQEGVKALYPLLVQAEQFFRQQLRSHPEAPKRGLRLAPTAPSRPPSARAHSPGR